MARRLLRHEVISRLVIAAMHEAMPHMGQRAIAAECHTSLRTVNQAVHQLLQY